MAYEAKHGDITLNVNKEKGENQPTAVGRVHLNGTDRPLKLYRKDDVQGKQPTHYGYVDGNDGKMNLSAWFAGMGEQPNRRPNITGRITVGDWEHPFALWERKGREIWWTGQIDFSEDRRKQAYKKDEGGQSSTPSQQLIDGFTEAPVAAPKEGTVEFDLDDSIPF